MKTQTENQIDDQNGNKSKPLLDEVSFSVSAYSIITDNTPKYCHWSEGLKMVINKNGVTIKLESTDKQTKVLNEEFTKIQHLMGYSRKTQ